MIKQNSVNLYSLANKLAMQLGLPIYFVGESHNDSHDTYLELDYKESGKSKSGIEYLALVRNHSENALDDERLEIKHSFLLTPSHKDEEETEVSYSAFNINYFRETFFGINGSENEFLKAIKEDYEAISKSKKSEIYYGDNFQGTLDYSKRVANNQRTLEEIFNYAASRWISPSSSTGSQPA